MAAVLAVGLVAGCTSRALPRMSAADADAAYGPVVAAVQKAVSDAVPEVTWKPLELRGSEGKRCVYQTGHVWGAWGGDPPREFTPDELKDVVAGPASAHGFTGAKGETVNGWAWVRAYDAKGAELSLLGRPGQVSVSVNVGC